jgi:hypothetical protein
MIHRQGAQTDGVHELKDGGIGAGAERQRQDGDRRERGVPAQQPRAVPQILPERLDEAQ